MLWEHRANPQGTNGLNGESNRGLWGSEEHSRHPTGGWQPSQGLLSWEADEVADREFHFCKEASGLACCSEAAFVN